MVVLTFFKRGFHTVFFIGLYALYLYMLFCIASVTDIGNLRHTGVRLLVAAVELSFFWSVCTLLLRRWLSSRRLGWIALYLLFATIICLVYVVQAYSIYVSNNFITVLGMQNAGYASFTESSTEWMLLACGGIWVLLLGINAGLLTRAANRRLQQYAVELSEKSTVMVFVVLALLTLAVFTQQRKRIVLEPDYRQSPFASMAVNAWLTVYGGGGVVASVKSVFSYKSCFDSPMDGKIRDYPFEKKLVYNDPLPFASTGARLDHPNVIVFFTEGTSVRLIDSYGGRYPGLTPNIDRLARRSMKVVDYYNHTAATYRGIIGQTSSGFSFAGGGGESGWVVSGKNESKQAEISRKTLASILSGDGYASYFFEPEHNGSTFTRMIQYLGFENVYTFEKISALLDGEVSIQKQTDQLDDGSLFRGLTAFLKKNAVSADRKPFLIATYNIGTHAFIPLTPGGLAYGDGKSMVLSKLHNYDAAIGSFLDYFYSSPYAKDTILVFTSDHATYPEKPYREVAGKDLKPFFVDKIPLLVYDPTHHLPEVFNAQGRNSLDMAPTLLQLLGIKNAQNSFLGNSLFEPRSFPVGVTALGDSFYITTPKGLFASGDVPDKLRGLSSCEQSVVNDYYGMEAKNRLFKPRK